MNATPAVSQAPSAIDPAQAGGPASADAARSGAGSQDFAAALSDAGPTPARKPAASKTHDGASAGGQLPVPGNLTPPPPPPAAAAGAAAAGAAASLAHGIPSGNAAAGAASGTATGAAPGTPTSAASGTATGTVSSTAIGAAPGGAGAPGAQVAHMHAEGGSLDAPAPHAKGTEDAGHQAVAARSGPSTTESDAAISSNDDTTTDDDASAEPPAATALAAAVAGAIAAAKAGSAGAADSPSAPANDLAPPAAGGAQAEDGSGAPPVPAIAAAVARAAAAAVGIGTAKAQGVAALAGAATADKHPQAALGGSVLADAPGNTIAGAAQLSAPATPTEVTSTPTLKVGAGVETPAFGQDLADRVSWMVDNNLNGAKLQVNPPQLGPIEVRIAVQGDQAQVWLTSHSAVTRDALEASSSQLREMLGGQGFGQVSVDISQRSFQERSSQTQSYDWTPAANRGASAAPLSATSTPRLSSGAVDAYA